MVFSVSTSIKERNDPADYAGMEKSLLIVEDHPVLAEYMEMVAEDLGWEVEVAGCAKEFKRKIEPCHPAVLALDLGLPDGDGVELLRHLSTAGYKGAILIISGCDESVLETCSDLAERAGLRVTGYVQKPLSAGVFTELLGRSVA